MKYFQGYSVYDYQDVFLIGNVGDNLDKKEKNISSGNISKVLNNSEFEHTPTNTPCTVGAPICLKDNLLVIGMAKENNCSILLGK